MPPLRLAILVDLTANPHSLVVDVRRRINKPHNTVDRELQALHMLGMVELREEMHSAGTRWLYSLSDGIDTTAVFPEIEVPPPPTRRRVYVETWKRRPGVYFYSWPPRFRPSRVLPKAVPFPTSESATNPTASIPL
jgi:hypothetical protein